MVLIIGETTQLDDDWVPFEIGKAVDEFKIPIIAAYTGIGLPVRTPSAFRSKWPASLAARIDNRTAHVIHIPFKKLALLDAITYFSHKSPPVGGGLGIYSDQAYVNFGITG